jgi:hypothetical protein
LHPDGGRAQALYLAGRSRKAGLLNHSREIKRAGSDLALPAHAISTKNKHLLVIYSIPTRGFTAAVSVFPFDFALRASLRVNPEPVEGFRGTPPPKPLECKFRLNTMGALFRNRWADPTGGEPRFSHARFNFVSVDIIEMSPSFRSQIVHLSLSLSVIQGNKKPCLICGKQGLEKSYGSSLTCLPPGYPNSFRGVALDTTRIGHG